MSRYWARRGAGALTGCESVSRLAFFLALQRRELDRIVRAEQLDVADRQPRELAQPGQIGAPRRVVDAHQAFERPQAPRRRAAARLDLGMVEIGVAAMEQPVLRPPHRHAAMSAGVAWQRDQEDLVVRSGNRTHRREAEPGLSLFLDHRPFLDSGNLHRAIAAALDEARPARGGAKLVGVNVDRCAGEIADAARMVEVEMGRHDVAHVAWADSPGPRPASAPSPRPRAAAASGG